jgi:hypothetical protein
VHVKLRLLLFLLIFPHLGSTALSKASEQLVQLLMHEFEVSSSRDRASAVELTVHWLSKVRSILGEERLVEIRDTRHCLLAGRSIGEGEVGRSILVIEMDWIRTCSVHWLSKVRSILGEERLVEITAALA